MLKRLLLNKYMACAGFFLLGIFVLALYQFDHWTELVNANMVMGYSNTSFGHQTLRLSLHDSCYFGAQHIALNKGATQVEFEYDQWCWEEADKHIAYLQQGLLPR